MSSRYGYDDKEVYPPRRDYGGGGGRSWDRSNDREWEREPPHWDRGGRDSRRDWDDRGPPPGRAYEPPPPQHWDHRDMDRMAPIPHPAPPPRDDWGGRNNWRPAPPPPAERDHVFRERDRMRDRPMDWEPAPPRVPLVRKREPDIYDQPRDFPPPRDTMRHVNQRVPPPEETDWKRRKVEVNEFEAGTAPPPPFNNDAPTAPHWENDHGQRRRLEPSEPSVHVIFLGMDPDFTEADLHAYLTAQGANLESVTVIRDKITGMSRGFGFAQFTDVAGASAFLLPNFPFIQLPPPALHSTQGHVVVPPPGGPRRVKIDFSQSAHQQTSEGGRGSRLPGSDAAKVPIKNDGTRDIGATPTEVLLIRSLDKATTIEEIAEALRATDGGAYGLRRILLICDRATGNGWGFAFIEMSDLETASSLLAEILHPKKYPTGFRISNRLIAASFALSYAFQLLPHSASKEPWCIIPSRAVGGVEEGEGWTRYWDESATIEEKKYEVVPKPKMKEEDNKMVIDPVAANPEPTPAKPTASVAPEPLAPTALPTTAGAFSLKFKSNKPDAADSKPTPAPVAAQTANALGFTADTNDASAADESSTVKEEAGTTATAEAKTITKVGPMVASSKVAKDINKWNQVKDERNETGESPAAAPAAAEASTSATPKAAIVIPELKPGDAGFEYGDPVALTCLLCLRQLKSLQQLQRHNNESEMHKNNLKNTMLCKVAAEKVASARRNVLNGVVKKPKAKSPTAGTTAATSAAGTAAVASGSEAADSGPKYRDRAQERRRVHNQPEVPIPAPARGKATSTPDVAPPEPVSKPAPPVDVGKDENNVGNKLLKKMGWSEGSGLGTEGEGRAEPVKAAVYASGAGLGASKGKEVTAFTSTSYADAVKEAARERYEG